MRISYTIGSSTIDPIWRGWVTDATSCTTSTNVTWSQWTATSYTSATTSTGYAKIWPRWCQDVPIHRPRIEIAESAAVQAARAADRARLAAEQTRRAEADAKADARAKKLLVTFLTPDQRATLEQHGYFDEPVPGHGTFRIYKGWAGNVRRLDAQGREKERFCIHPTETVPQYDNMLAQRLMLQTDPEGFLRTANRTVLS